MKNFEIINRLFSSKIRTKLLDAFLSLPKARFYIRELERKINDANAEQKYQHDRFNQYIDNTLVYGYFTD